MSGNTLPLHSAGQNLPAAVKIALAEYSATVAELTNTNVGDGYVYWQSKADAASVCACEIDDAADDAFADRNLDLLEEIQGIADDYFQRFRNFQDKADDALLDEREQSRPRPPVTIQYFVTARGQRFISLLSHDPTRNAAAGIITLLGQNELTDTLNDLHACQMGQFEQIRPITIKRGLIMGVPVPTTNISRGAAA